MFDSFFFYKTVGSSLGPNPSLNTNTIHNQTSLFNTRKKLTYRLFKLTGTYKFNTVYLFNTSFFNKRTDLKKNLFFLTNNACISFLFFNLTNSFYIYKTTRSIFFLSKLNLNVYAFITGSSNFLTFCNTQWFFTNNKLKYSLVTHFFFV